MIEITDERKLFKFYIKQDEEVYIGMVLAKNEDKALKKVKKYLKLSNQWTDEYNKNHDIGFLSNFIPDILNMNDVEIFVVELKISDFVDIKITDMFYECP